VDLVSAGFPCQPWSAAGKGRGTDDERWIWPEIACAIRDLGPGIVFLENVPPLVARGGLAPVLGDLASLGFDAEWALLRASAVGAPHGRERLFVLAWRLSNAVRYTLRFATERDQRGPAERGNAEPRDVGAELADARSDGRGGSGAGDDHDGDHASGRELDRCGSEVAYAEGLRGGEGIGRVRDGTRRPQLDDDGASVVNTNSIRLEGIGEAGAATRAVVRTSRDGLSPFPPGPTDADGWRRALECRPDLAPATKSPLRGVADGVAGRMGNTRAHELRLLGNGVVPAQAEAAFRLLAARALCLP
jgi:DNA (cytosine-5)-methyltransferase 1